jgi:hypothetical protein
MTTYKISTFIEKYKLNNIIKVLLILFILFFIYKYYTHNIYKKYSDTTTTKSNIIEPFSVPIYTYYGNSISLKNPENLPSYTQNKIIFELNDTYRLDTLVFKFNTSTIATGASSYSNEDIFIQYSDGNGNMLFLKTGNSGTSSPPNLKTLVNSTKTLTLTNIIDETNTVIYTSKIVLIIGDSRNNSNIYNYKAPVPSGTSPTYTNTGYIDTFAIFGGKRSLLPQYEYDILVRTLGVSTYSTTESTNVVDLIHNINTSTLTNLSSPNNDLKIYSLVLSVETTALPAAAAAAAAAAAGENNQLIVLTKSDKKVPINVNIQYSNTLYTSNKFNITNTYIIRTDTNSIPLTSIYIFLDEPIIANSLIFTIQNSSMNSYKVTNLQVNAITPTSTDLTDFKRNANMLLNSNNNNDEGSICPNINELIEKQTQTQAICDNLEYQDKVKSEKIRLERNKQYLLKLKIQQEQIDKLNTVIQDLDTKRQNRAIATDKLKVLQYQKQKGDASTIVDLANQRLQSQDANKLFLDLNLNYT